MYVIQKRFELSYSHQLDGLPAGHKCARVHGHNAVVEVSLAATELDDTGFVVDYASLDAVKTWLDNTFDHRHVNDIVEFNPTAENLAQFVFEFVQGMGFPVSQVGWSETPKTWAWYHPEDSRCACGSIHLAPGEPSVHLGGVRHRSDGPCYIEEG